MYEAEIYERMDRHSRYDWVTRDGKGHHIYRGEHPPEHYASRAQATRGAINWANDNLLPRLANEVKQSIQQAQRDHKRKLARRRYCKNKLARGKSGKSSQR